MQARNPCDRPLNLRSARIGESVHGGTSRLHLSQDEALEFIFANRNTTATAARRSREITDVIVFAHLVGTEMAGPTLVEGLEITRQCASPPLPVHHEHTASTHAIRERQAG